jgi:hypothetical protein
MHNSLFNFSKKRSRNSNAYFTAETPFEEVEAKDIEALEPVDNDDIRNTRVEDDSTISSDTTISVSGGESEVKDVNSDGDPDPTSSPFDTEPTETGEADENGSADVTPAEMVKKQLLDLVHLRDVIKTHGMTQSLHAFCNHNGDLGRTMGFSGKEAERLTSERFMKGFNFIIKRTRKFFK